MQIKSIRKLQCRVPPRRLHVRDLLGVRCHRVYDRRLRRRWRHRLCVLRDMRRQSAHHGRVRRTGRRLTHGQPRVAGPTVRSMHNLRRWDPASGRVRAHNQDRLQLRELHHMHDGDKAQRHVLWLWLGRLHVRGVFGVRRGLV